MTQTFLHQILSLVDEVTDEQVTAAEFADPVEDEKNVVGELPMELRRLFVGLNQYLDLLRTKSRETAENPSECGHENHRRFKHLGDQGKLCHALFWSAVYDAFPQLISAGGVMFRKDWKVEAIPPQHPFSMMPSDGIGVLVLSVGELDQGEESPETIH